jgi:hypothetical protein
MERFENKNKRLLQTDDDSRLEERSYEYGCFKEEIDNRFILVNEDDQF